MRRLLREDEFPAFAVELRPPVDKLFYVFGPFGDKGLDRAFVAQARPGDERVALVQCRLVVFRKHDGDTALGVFRIRFARLVLGENGHVRPPLRKSYRGPKAGNPAANDDKVRDQRHYREFNKLSVSCPDWSRGRPAREAAMRRPDSTGNRIVWGERESISAASIFTTFAREGETPSAPVTPSYRDAQRTCKVRCTPPSADRSHVPRTPSSPKASATIPCS